MKFGFRGDAGDELINANRHAKNDELLSLEFSASDVATSKDSTADPDAMGEERSLSIWDVFVNEAPNDMSTIEDPSLLSEETSELMGEGYISRASSVSSDERNSPTATTSVYSSGYGGYECCGVGSISSDDDDQSDPVEESHALDIQDKQRKSFETYTVSTTETFSKQIPKDVAVTLSQTESITNRANPLWDEEVETQHLSQGDVMIRVGTNTEETIDGSLSANTDEKQSSLLRNILFKRKLVNRSHVVKTRSFRRLSQGVEAREEPNDDLGEVNVPECTQSEGDSEQHETSKKESTASNAADFGAVSLLIASMLSADRVDVTNFLSHEVKEDGKDTTSTGVLDSPSQNMDRKVSEKEILRDKAGKFRLNRWRIFNSESRIPTNETVYCVDTLRMSERPQVGVKRCNSSNTKARDHAKDLNHFTEKTADVADVAETKGNGGKIGQRIEQAKDKSEARRSSRKMQMQTLEQQLKVQKTYGNRPSRAQYESSKRRKTRYTPTPLCGSMNLIDTIFGDAWESQSQNKAIIREKRQGRSKRSRRSSKRLRHRSSMKHPLCGVGLAFHPNYRLEGRQRSASERRRDHLMVAKSGDARHHLRSSRHDIQSGRRSRSLPRPAAPFLCGAVVPFSLLDHDYDRLRHRSRRGSTSRTRRESLAGHSRQNESDFKRRTSSPLKQTWRTRLLGKKNGRESTKQHRPIPGMLPTSKSDLKT